MRAKKILIRLGALGVGIVNGLLGAGGGMLAVPLLNASGLPQRKAHATSIAVILPISLLSAGLYLAGGHASIADVLPYVPWGLIGALLGVWMLRSISNSFLRRIFGVFMLWAAIRLLIR